jgi:hypothetical protein
VCLGETEVFPGDLIVGDRDGIVAIPRDRVSEAIQLGRTRVDKERSVLTALRAGTITLEHHELSWMVSGWPAPQSSTTRRPSFLDKHTYIHYVLASRTWW